MAGFGGGEQGLGGDAADVHAGAADDAALDHHHAQISAPRRDRRGEGAAARADDGQVVAELARADVIDVA